MKALFRKSPAWKRPTSRCCLIFRHDAAQSRNIGAAPLAPRKKSLLEKKPRVFWRTLSMLLLTLLVLALARR